MDPDKFVFAAMVVLSIAIMMLFAALVVTVVLRGGSNALPAPIETPAKPPQHLRMAPVQNMNPEDAPAPKKLEYWEKSFSERHYPPFPGS